MGAVSRDGDPKVYLWINPKFRTADEMGENEEAERILAESDIIYAHNASNEMANTWGALEQGKACPFKTMPPETVWRCTAAMARKAGLPYSLEKLCDTLKIKDSKDRAGKALIQFFCIPDEDTGLFNEPKDHPEKWSKFCEYCRQDVRAETECGQKLKPFELTGAALATFQFDLRMNQRGIPINLKAAQNAQKIIDNAQAGVKDEFRKLTGLNPTQGKKFKVWLKDKCSLDLPNLQGPTVEAALSDPLGDPKTLHILTMYQAVSYAAVKKIQTMLDCVCPDGMIRGTFMYYGAGTGRWSAQKLQPHNFKKCPPELRDVSGAIYEAICNGISAEMLDQVYCSPLEAIASCIRHFIQHPDYEMLDGDYSGVEARIIAWLAGQDDVLQEWRDYDSGKGLGPYKHMAADIYEIAVDVVNKDQREVGKRAILGCFAYDTPVLTRSGLRPIGEIDSGDWLWDGVDWVQSDGVVFSGCKPTINFHGINATSNHRVLCGDQWLPLVSLAQNAFTRSQALETALESLKSPGMSWERVEELSAFASGALAEHQSTTSTPRAFKEALLRDATRALKSSHTIGEKSSGVTRMSFPRPPFASDCLTGFQAASHDAIAEQTLNGDTTGGAASACLIYGAKTEKSFCDTSSHCPTILTPNEKLTEWTTQGDMNQAISGLPQGEKTSAIAGLSQQCKSALLFSNPRCEDSLLLPVYDISNCGPRNRFMVMTSAGPLLVHNCGFQMGWRKFQSSCKIQYQLDLPDDLCKKAIKAFRQKCKNIRDYWWHLNRCAIEAIKTSSVSGPFSVRTVAGIPYLLFKLRSGRSLAYPYPEVALVRWIPEKEFDEHGEEIPQDDTPKFRDEITYWGQLPMSQVWGRVKLYGGKLAENETQATAADFMAHGAINAEKQGMAPFMLVHDQGLALRNRSQSEDQFAAALADLPSWARGFPMKVEAGITKYFTKE